MNTVPTTQTTDDWVNAAHIRNPVKIGECVPVRTVARSSGKPMRRSSTASGSTRRRRMNCTPGGYCEPATGSFICRVSDIGDVPPVALVLGGVGASRGEE